MKKCKAFRRLGIEKALKNLFILESKREGMRRRAKAGGGGRRRGRGRSSGRLPLAPGLIAGH